MSVALQEQCEKPLPPSPAGLSPGWIFVSSTLATWETATPERFVRDFQINDRIYRRLDSDYYAWLRWRMVLAKKAATAGRLDATAFEELRIRFNGVHDWAIKHLGEERMLAALRPFRSREYKPPVADGNRPRCGRRSTANQISPDAIALVDPIADNALALGWRRERLYEIGNSLFDPRRGLVCFLKPGDRIGEVTAQSIEIIHPPPSEVHHRFYNPDAEQPWMKKICSEP